MTQSEQILELLARRGDKGATNRELNEIAFRYGARIHELRKEGWTIRTEQIKRGYFRFYLDCEHSAEVDGGDAWCELCGAPLQQWVDPTDRDWGWDVAN